MFYIIKDIMCYGQVKKFIYLFIILCLIVEHFIKTSTQIEIQKKVYLFNNL